MFGLEDNGVNTYAPPSTNSLGPYLLGLRTLLYNAFPDFDEIMDPNIDAPLSQMTIRDLAAIMLKKPVSNKAWLNEIIKSK